MPNCQLQFDLQIDWAKSNIKVETNGSYHKLPQDKHLKHKKVTGFYKFVIRDVKNEMQIPQNQEVQTNERLAHSMKMKHIPNLNK